MQNPSPPEIQDGTLSVRIAAGDSVCTLSVKGELDLANAATLADQLEMLVRVEDARVVLDMTELEFIDSTGIALLVSMHQRLNREGSERFRIIASTDPSVQRVMTLTGLDTELPFSENGYREPDAG